MVVEAEVEVAQGGGDRSVDTGCKAGGAGCNGRTAAVALDKDKSEEDSVGRKDVSTDEAAGVVVEFARPNVP